MKVKKYIEIVASTNPRLNAMSFESQQTMLSVLRKQYAKVAITYVDTKEDLDELLAKNPDLVVLGVKLVLESPDMPYDQSSKIWLSQALDDKGICFTGSNTHALAIEFDKPIAKQVVLDAGLQSANYFISSIGEHDFSHTLTFPLFVKPTNRGDSKGIDEFSVVHSQADLERKILSIHNECASNVLVEEYLSGREFSVAVIRVQGSNLLAAMPIEIIAPADKNGNTFLSEKVKEADTEQVVAVTDDELRTKLSDLAIGVFKALGARDYGRIDLRLDASGTPQFIEANLMPGLSDHGYLSRCLHLNDQSSYDAMILHVVGLAFERENTLPSSFQNLSVGNKSQPHVTYLPIL